jgi:hypothetical protein
VSDYFKIYYHFFLLKFPNAVKLSGTGAMACGNLTHSVNMLTELSKIHTNYQNKINISFEVCNRAQVKVLTMLSSHVGTCTYIPPVFPVSEPTYWGMNNILSLCSLVEAKCNKILSNSIVYFFI